MIVTNRFLFVHLPKTGGTFVRRVLEQLHDLLDTRAIKKGENEEGKRISLKHGRCVDIPETYRDLPILTTFRHPHDLYVSIYKFAYWRTSKNFDLYLSRFKGDFPTYPDLSFEDFLRLYTRSLCAVPANRNFEDPDRFGWATERFVQYFARMPEETMFALNHDSVRSGRLQNALFDVDFLFTHRLNTDLHAYLLNLGLPADRLSFILDLQQIYPEGSTRPATARWQSYYTPELRQHTRQRERLLFELFPEFEA